MPTEAAQLYNDCLVALDFDDDEAQNLEARQKLQLPICTNLAACLIEHLDVSSGIGTCPSVCKVLAKDGKA